MKKLILIAVTILSLGIVSCKKSSTNSSSANVTVKLTDGPGPYDAVILSIKSIIINTSGGEQTLTVGGGPIDILHFRSGKDTLLAAQNIPPGTIQQVRLVLNATGNRVVINGTSYDLNTPSGQTAGIKLNANENITAGTAYTLRLDFDAAQSIVSTGNGKYQLKPVIRVIASAASGVLTGTVSPIAAYPKVYAIAGTDTVGTVADETGKFYFPGLPAGNYSVKFLPVSPYVTKTISNVVVTSGTVQDMGTVTINK